MLESGELSKVPEFEEHVRTTVHKVRNALADLLDSVDADPSLPQDMARRFKLNKNLTWKVSRIVCESDPYAPIPHFPGRSGLNIFMESLIKAGAPQENVSAVLEAIDAFNQMVEVHAGDRATLEMMLSNLTHDGEQQRSEAHRKLSFRGNSATWGVQAKLQITANFIAPSENPDMMDMAWISGFADLRRLRHDVPWAIAAAKLVNDEGAPLSIGPFESLDPNFSGEGQAPLLGEYCSSPIPKIRTDSSSKDMLRYELLEGPVGATAATTCIIGLTGKAFLRKYRIEGDTLGEHFARLSTPVELLVHDLFVHKDLSFAMNPEIALYSHLPGGPTYPYAGRDCGKLPLYEKVVNMGMGSNGARLTQEPKYRKMVQSVYERLDWNGSDFCCLRFLMRYPPIPALAVLRYGLPEKPKTT